MPPNMKSESSNHQLEKSPSIRKVTVEPKVGPEVKTLRLKMTQQDCHGCVHLREWTFSLESSYAGTLIKQMGRAIMQQLSNAQSDKPGFQKNQLEAGSLPSFTDWFRSDKFEACPVFVCFNLALQTSGSQTSWHFRIPQGAIKNLDGQAAHHNQYISMFRVGWKHQ